MSITFSANFLYYSQLLTILTNYFKIPVVTKPNIQAFVYVRFFFKKQSLNVFGYIGIEIREDCIYYLPYEQIKEYLESGQAQLV